MTLRELLVELKTFFAKNPTNLNAYYFQSQDFEVIPGLPLIEGYEVVGRGCTRLAIRRRGHLWVWKIPLRPFGTYDNEREFRLYQANYYPHARKAKCKLYYVCGVPLLLMEWVDITNVPTPLPLWVQHIESNQVGTNRRGELRAYDYASSFKPAFH